MSWAARRRFFILLIVGAVVVAFLAILSIATFYDAPSCTDNKKNADEEGIDCGGSCAYLCTELMQPPTVLFTKTISNGVGRIDIVASIENKNETAAVKDVPYRVQLYGKDQLLMQEVSGTFDLLPGITVPVYIPGVISGKQIVAHSFLIIDQLAPKWFALHLDPSTLPLVSRVNQVGTLNAPRIEAVIANPSVVRLTDVRVIVLVRNEKGDVIAASATVLPSISPQGQAMATFTWNSAFSSVPASIEVVPIMQLP